MNIIGFSICLKNDDYSVSLELHKIYPVVAPLANDPEEYIRIIDESGEDYLIPADWFESVSLGSRIESLLRESVVA